MSEVITCGSGIDAKQVVNTLLAKINNAQSEYDGCVGVRIEQYTYQSCLPLICDTFEDFWMTLGRAFAPGDDLKPVLRVVIISVAREDLEDFPGCGVALEVEQAWKYPFCITTTDEVALLLYDFTAPE